MQDTLSGAVIRLHGPLNLRLWDRMVLIVGVAFVALGALLLALQDHAASATAVIGGVAFLMRQQWDRRKHANAVWTLAAQEDDPIRALALYEYLYGLRFRDLLVLADWRARREALGLDVWDAAEDPDAPPQARALLSHVYGNPRE